MKKPLCLILCLCLCLCAVPAPGEEAGGGETEEAPVAETLAGQDESGPDRDGASDLMSAALADGTGETDGTDYVSLFSHMAAAAREPSAENLERLDRDAAALRDPVALAVAENWKRLFLDPEYRLYIYGRDDPSALPAAGRHAFALLGFRLENGEMAEELIGRCDAAAAAARAFPGSVIVCSGGATGENNPEGHTEAGLMKAYLVEKCGIAPERVYIDENAMTTAENARNTLEILKELNVASMTVITSSYHQKRGQMLYAAMAAKVAKEQGYAVKIAGNFCFEAEGDEYSMTADPMIAIWQLTEILELPEVQAEEIMGMLRNMR